METTRSNPISRQDGPSLGAYVVSVIAMAQIRVYAAQQQILREVLSTTKREEVFMVGHMFGKAVDVSRESDALGLRPYVSIGR